MTGEMVRAAVNERGSGGSAGYCGVTTAASFGPVSNEDPANTCRPSASDTVLAFAMYGSVFE
jgi:hypothetical protein